MQTNIVWCGIAWHSMEHCRVQQIEQGATVHSTLVGYYEKQAYSVIYTIRTNQLWETVFAALTIRSNDTKRSILLEKQDGRWHLDGKLDEQFTNCVDIDISLTPFTNTLPIRRLPFHHPGPELIEVVYIDILQDEIKPVKQFYTRLSAASFLYENFDKQFTAAITVNKEGLVIRYPELFVMEYEQSTH